MNLITYIATGSLAHTGPTLESFYLVNPDHLDVALKMITDLHGPWLANITVQLNENSYGDTLVTDDMVALRDYAEWAGKPRQVTLQVQYRSNVAVLLQPVTAWAPVLETASADPDAASQEAVEGIVRFILCTVTSPKQHADSSLPRDVSQSRGRFMATLAAVTRHHAFQPGSVRLFFTTDGSVLLMADHLVGDTVVTSRIVRIRPNVISCPDYSTTCLDFDDGFNSHNERKGVPYELVRLNDVIADWRKGKDRGLGTLSDTRTVAAFMEFLVAAGTRAALEEGSFVVPEK